MATYFVYSGAGGTASGADWTNAFVTLAAGVSAANAAGDIIKVHKTHTEALGSDTTYTALANISIVCVDKDASDALAVMDDTVGIGNSGTTSSAITLGGAFRVFVYGLLFRIVGSSAKTMRVCGTDGGHYSLESCYLWQNTNSSGVLGIGASSSSGNHYTKLTNCTLRFGHASQFINPVGVLDIDGGELSSAGAEPTNLISNGANAAVVSFVGTNLAHKTTGSILGSSTFASIRVTLDRCILGTPVTGATLLATQTITNKASGAVLALDCDSGDVHGMFGYADALGSVVLDTGIYYTGSTAGNLSWKITTTANATPTHPFVSPWISGHEAAAGPVTPRLEILRDGSTTAYDNDEVWCEAFAKVTSGSTKATRYTDGMAFGGTPAAQAAGAGLGSWTGESGTAWSGKIDTGSAITFAEAGDLSMRVCVGVASSTVYVNPVPLTA